MRNHHFLLVCFPSQGYINPSLQLAQRLITLNVEVTFATTITATRRMNKPEQTSTALSFATLSDGFDDESRKPTSNFSHYFSELKRCGSQSLTNLVTSAAKEGRPFTFVIYSLLLNWAADVATSFDIPSALFFAQPATVFALYYYYFHGYNDTLCNKEEDIELPGLPLSFTSQDMPSFFSPSGPHAFIIPLMREEFEYLGRQSHPTPTRVLVNTFDSLESEALRAIGELKMLGIGPLIPFDDGLSSFRGDLFKLSSEDYIGWLNSKADKSVVYVSFGSICELSEQQEEEILHGLLESGYRFLWVIRSNNDEKLRKLVEGRGKIVTWCSQIEVLKHGSLGCFMTHCGWNSTIESLSFGLPMVGFPQQIDQATNAKLVEDLWKTGVRVKANEDGFVERDEIRRCLDLVMESKDDGRKQEIDKNVKKWKELAREAITQPASSMFNLKTFVAEIDGVTFT